MQKSVISPLIYCFLLSSPIFAGEIHFTLVIPSYNNEEWVRRCLHSVATQTYPHWSLYYIDDSSTDTTAKMAEEFFKEFRLQSKVVLIRNKTRQKALANLYSTIHQCKPREVIVLLDGDDHLAHKDVLAHLAAIYANKNVWMTYGNFVSHPPGWSKTRCKPFPAEISQKNSFRSYPWVASHLRSFYAKLFQLIKKEDLMWRGQFFPVAWDLAIMFPMLEMASRGHWRYVQEVLYVYNVANPLMDCKKHFKLQGKLNKHIRAKKAYQPLSNLF